MKSRGYFRWAFAHSLRLVATSTEAVRLDFPQPQRDRDADQRGGGEEDENDARAAHTSYLHVGVDVRTI